jgi:acetyl esterase/lipase
MAQDAIDAHLWCRENLPQILGAGNVDVDALVVGGDSAGGTMSTLAGINLNPSPKVVLDIYGVTDATDPYFTGRGVDESTPAEQARKNFFKLSGKFTEEEIAAALAETDPRKAQHIVPWTWEVEPAMSLETLRSFWGVPDFQVTPEHTLRMDMLGVLDRNRKLFRKLARRHDVDEDSKLDDPDALDKLLLDYSPFHLVDIKGTYPATFFLHGDVDMAVPVAQSRNMAKKLRTLGVPVGEAYSPEGNHCFDNVIEVSKNVCRTAARPAGHWYSLSLLCLHHQEPTDAGWNEYIVPCMDFIDKHIRTV